MLRAFDEAEVYQGEHWDFIEQDLQRIAQKHPHAIDYICLLVAKRIALGKAVDTAGWSNVADIIVLQSLAISHDHEVLWMAWPLVVLGLGLSPAMTEELARSKSAHIRSFLVQASVDGRIKRKPKLALGSALSSADSSWLMNLVARSQGFSKTSFAGHYADEFDHLAKRKIRLTDFDAHIIAIRNAKSRAISRTRYGYDDDGEDEDIDDFAVGPEAWPGFISFDNND